jgi:hypothetical protein
MVATQQVGEKDDMRAFEHGSLDVGLTCRKWWGYDLCQNLL